MSHPRQHQAHYDADGNIIIDDDLVAKEARNPVLASESIQEVIPHSRHSRHGAWKVQEEKHESPKSDVSIIQKSQSSDTTASVTKDHHSTAVSSVAIHTKSFAEKAVSEGKKQLSETMKNVQGELAGASMQIANAPKRTRGLLKRVWASATKPIVIPGSKRTKKPRSKLTLFCIDTIRFGGTFALIFGVLFSAINYQSFYQIAKAELALGSDLKTEKALQDMVSGTDGTVRLSGTIGDTKNVKYQRAYLPAVGPMEDRLVIPKLGKNVPIVRPSMDALMREDWKQFEVDIQEALKGGVVHYPGSAKPGQAGNFFLTGHSSFYPWVASKYKDVFARLGELSLGDTYSVYYGGDRHTYRIIQKKEVKPSDVTVLDQPTDKRLATLMTCTPVGTTLRRLILVAEEIDPRTNLALTVGEKVVEKNTQNVKLNALPI